MTTQKNTENEEGFARDRCNDGLARHLISPNLAHKILGKQIRHESGMDIYGIQSGDSNVFDAYGWVRLSSSNSEDVWSVEFRAAVDDFYTLKNKWLVGIGTNRTQRMLSIKLKDEEIPTIQLYSLALEQPLNSDSENDSPVDPQLNVKFKKNSPIPFLRNYKSFLQTINPEDKGRVSGGMGYFDPQIISRILEERLGKSLDIHGGLGYEHYDAYAIETMVELAESISKDDKGGRK